MALHLGYASALLACHSCWSSDWKIPPIWSNVRLANRSKVRVGLVYWKRSISISELIRLNRPDEIPVPFITINPHVCNALWCVRVRLTESLYGYFSQKLWLFSILVSPSVWVAQFQSLLHMKTRGYIMCTRPRDWILNHQLPSCIVVMKFLRCGKHFGLLV